MIKIVTDSTCDLSPSIIDALGITVQPLHIQVGDDSYLDGVDISREQFYQRLPTFHTHPTTAAPGIGVFGQAYQQCADAGASEILSIHISESLSATVSVARLAAAEKTAVPVTVLDSGQLSMGMGFMVQRAAQAAAEGCGMEEILRLLADQGRRTHVYAVIDTLEYLRRSGRMNRVVAGIGGVLRLKPILKMNQGIATSERVRTRGRAEERLMGLLHALGPIEQAAAVHAHAPDRAAEMTRLAGRMLPPGDIPSVEITPVLGAHLGTDAVGFAVVTKA